LRGELSKSGLVQKSCKRIAGKAGRTACNKQAAAEAAGFVLRSAVRK